MNRGWVTKKLGDVCQTGSGGTPLKSRKEFYEGGSIPWLMSGEVSQRDVLHATNFITQKGLENSSAKIFPRNTVLVAMYGATAGQTGILRFEAATNQAVCGVFPNEHFVPEFLFYCLLSRKDELIAQATGNAQPNISQIKIRNTEVPVPPLPEQQRIVAILDEALEGIATSTANAEKNLSNARALFESYLQSVYTSKGAGWVETKLGLVYDVRDGTHDSPKYHATGYPLITSKNLKRDGLDFDDLKLISEEDYRKINARSLVHKGDVLFAMIGTIGNPTVVMTEPNFAIKNVALFKLNPFQSSNFLKYYLDSQMVISKMMAEAKGTTQKFVGLGYLRDFPIHLPPLGVQRIIVAKLDDLSAETKKLEIIYQQKLVALDELKKSILHQAFSGHLH